MREPVFEEVVDGFRIVLFNEKLKVTEQVTKLIEVLEKEMTVKELMDKVAIKHRPTFIYNYIKPAIELGLVELTIPEKPKSSNQKYRLTALGQGYIGSLKSN